MINSAQLRRRALIIVVIGILLSGFPIQIFSLLIYRLFSVLPSDYASFIFVIPVLVTTLITVGLIILAATLSKEKTEELEEEKIPTAIMIDVSYAKHIAVELTEELSKSIHPFARLKWDVITIDTKLTIHGNVRKVIERFLQRKGMHKHTVIWDGRKFVILRIINIEKFGLYIGIHSGALFLDPMHENYYRWAHYPPVSGI